MFQIEHYIICIIIYNVKGYRLWLVYNVIIELINKYLMQLKTID